MSLVVRFNRTKQVSDALLDGLRGLVRDAAFEVEAEAKTRAPVDTGFLRSSIGAEQVDENTWEVKVGAEYGAYVEYGTRFTPAQPYLTPAVEAVRPRLNERVRKLASE